MGPKLIANGPMETDGRLEVPTAPYSRMGVPARRRASHPKPIPNRSANDECPSDERITDAKSVLRD
jgi:hypothetical protein